MKRLLGMIMIKSGFRKSVLVLAAGALFLPISTAQAQTPKPKEIRKHKDWGAYTYNDKRAGKICYILSVPKTKEPVDRDHGDVFFLVSQKPDGSSGYEPQVEVGYPLKSGEPVVVNVDGKTFNMFTKGNNAWLENISEEPELISAMQAGRSMKVSGQSGRGTQTTYTYSLSGVTAALKEVANCK